MDVTKGYQLPGDIGGPMNVSEGYRWNMPVVTYGFDRSFLDYFGSNGVAAVESAVQMLNQVPSASLLNLTNYPNYSWGMNYRAQAINAVDLKSTVLSLLVEHLGLASPERYVFSIRDYQPSGNSYLFYLIQRNFDPVTALPSPSVNNTLFTYQIFQSTNPPSPTNVFCIVNNYPTDPYRTGNRSIADFIPTTGLYAINLSQDDVGGLRYLLNGNQINYESLLPDVRATDPNTTIVRSAYRPGIEKITFVRHPASNLSGQFKPFTNQWMDVYYTADDYPDYQEVERVTTTPDILFTAGDLGPLNLYQRTGTSNWVNNANSNGNPGGAGPGIISPPLVITLNNANFAYSNHGPSFLTQLDAVSFPVWGSFDGSTNPPIIYPAGQVLFQPTQVRFNLAAAGRTNNFAWFLPGVANGRFYFQTATNLTSWTTLATLTNSGTAFEYGFQALTNEPTRFFRLLAE